MQGIVGALRAVGGDPLIAPNSLQGSQNSLFGDAVIGKNPFYPTLGTFQQPQQQVLYGYILVLHGLGFILGGVEGGNHAGIRIHLVKIHAAADSRDLLQLSVCGGIHAFQGDTHLFQQLGNQPIALTQKGTEQVNLLQLLIVILCRNALCVLDSLFGLVGVDIKIHSHPSFLVLALSLIEC